jgi:hypothetical protein
LSVKLFRLPDDLAEAMQAGIGQEAIPAYSLASTQHLVLADAGSLSAVMEAFDESTVLTAASWYAVCDGQPQEYLIAFGGDEAVANAQTLVAELQGSGLTARRSTVAHAARAEHLVTHAKAAASASRQSRMRVTRAR